MAHITPKDARNYLNRWGLVHEMEATQLRGSSMDLKARQLAVLMASRDLFETDQTRAQELIGVRERWAAIRRALSG